LWELQQQQQEAAEQQDRGYWLVTPAASPGASPSSVCSSYRQSPAAGISAADVAVHTSRPAVVCGVDSSFCAASSSSAAADVVQLQQPRRGAANSEDAAAAVAGAAAAVLQLAVRTCDETGFEAALAQTLLDTDVAAVGAAEHAVESDVAAAEAAAGEEVGDLLGAELCHSGWGDDGDGDWAAALGTLEVGAAASTHSKSRDQPLLC
jgi:hypothetical protein